MAHAFALRPAVAPPPRAVAEASDLGESMRSLPSVSVFTQWGREPEPSQVIDLAALDDD